MLTWKTVSAEARRKLCYPLFTMIVSSKLKNPSSIGKATEYCICVLVQVLPSY